MQKPNFVLNWKLNRPYSEAVAWCTEHAHDLSLLAERAHIILCPEITSLAALAPVLPQNIALGAQYCSSVNSGNYTGAISAQSLAELGCTYCMVGHHETRRLFHLTDHDIAATMATLMSHQITPIICIGEAQHIDNEQERSTYLLKQLAPLEIILTIPHPHNRFIIAYEPVWAIGAPQPPPPAYLLHVGQALHQWSGKFPAFQISWLYGGAVQETAIHELQKLTIYDGFILGRASLDMQTLKKLVY
jgi:triosephosphate isomerase (TIM)